MAFKDDFGNQFAHIKRCKVFSRSKICQASCDTKCAFFKHIFIVKFS